LHGFSQGLQGFGGQGFGVSQFALSCAKIEEAHKSETAIQALVFVNFFNIFSSPLDKKQAGISPSLVVFLVQIQSIGLEIKANRCS
jgi:hypothetical protein